jgi:uroporphyrinogen-III synthase
VRGFFERCDLKPETEIVLRKLKNRERLSPKFACVGPATKRMLEERGFRSSFEPREFLTRALATELGRLVDLRNQNVLLARAETAAREIHEILVGAGAKVIDAPVYRTESQPMIAPDKLQSVTDITLTSPSTVEALIEAIPADEINSRRILIHCIGPVTAERAELKGLRISSVAANHTIDGLIDSMVQCIAISRREN